MITWNARIFISQYSTVGGLALQESGDWFRARWYLCGCFHLKKNRSLPLRAPPSRVYFSRPDAIISWRGVTITRSSERSPDRGSSGGAAAATGVAEETISSSEGGILEPLLARDTEETGTGDEQGGKYGRRRGFSLRDVDLEVSRGEVSHSPFKASNIFKGLPGIIFRVFCHYFCRGRKAVMHALCERTPRLPLFLLVMTTGSLVFREALIQR